MPCRLGQHSSRAGARAVILAPTRELALQTARVVHDLGKHTNLRTATLVSHGPQSEIVSTPSAATVSGHGRDALRQLVKLMFGRIRCMPLLQVGGDSMEAQFAELAGNPDVIVATPGRLAHHLAEVSGFGLKTVEYIVFDEADR